MPDAKLRPPSSVIRRPADSEIDQIVGALLKDRDVEFATAYQAIIRRKNKAIWEAGFEAGVQATLAAVQN